MSRFWYISPISTFRIENERPALLQRIIIDNVDKYAIAVGVMLRDCVRIIAPPGCRDAVQQFEREANVGYEHVLATALWESGVRPPIRFTETHIVKFIHAVTRGC